MRRSYKELPYKVLSGSLSVAIGLASIALETGAYLLKSKRWSKLAMQLELYGFELTEQTLYNNNQNFIKRDQI